MILSSITKARNYASLVFFLFFIGDQASAQLPLSLKDAVDSAMSRSPDIKQYQANLTQKQYYNKSSVGAFLPKVDVVGGYTFFSQIP